MFKRYLIAGILVWIPIWVTLLILKFLIDLFDSSMSLLPFAYQPDNLLGFHVPGLGLVISLLIMFFTGVIVTNFFGRKLVKLWEALLARIPVVRSVYTAVKQVLETVFSSNDKAFRKVLLVQYPRQGIWSIAFLTGQTSEAFSQAAGKTLVAMFVPTTPNPTSGFLIMVPKEDVIELNMTIDEAMKMVISLGVVQPKHLVKN